MKSKFSQEVKNEIFLLLKQERNLVVKERLTFVSMFTNGICKRDISNIVGRTKETVGKWVNAYFEGGIDALQDNRGGDHSSYLTDANKQELKDIITKTYPIVYKGWDGKIIIDFHDRNFFRQGDGGGGFLRLRLGGHRQPGQLDHCQDGNDIEKQRFISVQQHIVPSKIQGLPARRGRPLSADSGDYYIIAHFISLRLFFHRGWRVISECAIV